MKKYLLVYLFLFLSPAIFAQAKKDLMNADTTAYPIYGSFLISDNGMGPFKTLEFWIHDKYGRQVYHVIQGIPTHEQYAHIIHLFIDKMYIEFMDRHGKQMVSKGNK